MVKLYVVSFFTVFSRKLHDFIYCYFRNSEKLLQSLCIQSGNDVFTSARLLHSAKLNKISTKTGVRGDKSWCKSHCSDIFTYIKGVQKDSSKIKVNFWCLFNV